MPALFAVSSVHQALQHFLVVREASLRSWGDTCPQFTETLHSQWPMYYDTSSLNLNTVTQLQHFKMTLLKRNWVAPTSRGRRSSLGKRVGELPIKIPATIRDPDVVALTRCSPRLPFPSVSLSLWHAIMEIQESQKTSPLLAGSLLFNDSS